jgi:hypothetical protein
LANSKPGPAKVPADLFLRAFFRFVMASRLKMEDVGRINVNQRLLHGTGNHGSGKGAAVRG